MLAINRSYKSLVAPQYLLNTRTATIVCFVFAAICKVILVNVFYSFTLDMNLQGLAAQSIAEGHGFTIPQVHASNLSELVYNPLVGWPPAFSISIAPFYLLLHNIEQAGIVAFSFYSVLFIPLSYLLLKEIGFTTWLLNLFILIYGLSIPQYLSSFAATDLPGLLCYLLACYLLLLFLKNNKRPILSGILVGIACASGAWFRYMYLPVSFVIPVLLLWNGVLKKNKTLQIAGVYAFLCNLILVLALIGFQRFYTGNAAYYRPTEIGLYFSNLTSFHPYVFSTFMKLHFYIMKISLWTGIPYLETLQIINIAGVIPGILMAYLFCRYALKWKAQFDSPLQTFFIAGGFMSLCCIVILLALTIFINSEYRFPSNFSWVYGSEERYFILPIFCLQAFFLWWVFLSEPANRFRFIKIVRLFFLLIIAFEFFHGFGAIVKSLNGNSVQKNSIAEVEDIRTHIRNAAAVSSKQGMDLVIGTQGTIVAGQATLLGHKELFNLFEINSTPVYCSRPTLLTIFIKEAHLPYFKDFLQKHHGQQQSVMASGFYIYYCYLATGEN